MTPLQIIKADTENRGNDPMHEAMFFHHMMTNKAEVLRKNNTLLVLLPLEENNFELHLYTDDDAKKLYESMQDFWKQIENRDIKKVYTDITNQKVLELAQRTGWNIQPSDNEKYNAMAVVSE